VPAAKSVVDELMAEKPPYNPESCTLYTYPPIRVFAQAVAKAKSVKLDDLSKALHSMTAQPVGGPLTWDIKGDIVDPKYVFFYIWKNGTCAGMKTTLRRPTTARPAPGSAVDVGSDTGAVL
jgi:branched-chain amino acid transport system substrate-binding protein